MKKSLLLAVILTLFIMGPRWAFADTTTSRFGMTKPDVGSTNWGPKINSNYDIIDNAAGVGISNTFTQTNYFTGVVVVGGTTYTGTGQFEVRKDQASDTILGITNGTNSSGAAARLILTTAGSSAGNPYATFNDGTQNWSIGIDNANSHKFKISNSTSIGTSDRFVIDSSSVSIASGNFNVVSGTITAPVLALSSEFKPGLLSSTSGQILVSQGANAAPKFQWSGEVVQISTFSMNATTATTVAVFVPTTITKSITPKNAADFIRISVCFSANLSNVTYTASYTIYRNSSINLGDSIYGLASYGSAGSDTSSLAIPICLQYVDAPNTTSATTYTVYFRNQSGGVNVVIGYGGSPNYTTSSMILEEIPPSGN